MTKGTRAARHTGAISRAAAMRSVVVMPFSRSCTNVAPPATASATHDESVRPASQAESVTA